MAKRRRVDQLEELQADASGPGAAVPDRRPLGASPPAPPPKTADREARGIGFRRPSGHRPGDLPDLPFEALAVMVGQHRLAIPMDRIRAILPYRAPASVPLAPPSVEGILDHEGDVLAVIDTRARLGLPGTSSDRLTRLIVLGGTTEPAALRVDATGEQALIAGEAFDRAPGMAITPGASFIRGVVRLPNGLALLA